MHSAPATPPCSTEPGAIKARKRQGTTAPKKAARATRTGTSTLPTKPRRLTRDEREEAARVQRVEYRRLAFEWLGRSMRNALQGHYITARTLLKLAGSYGSAALPLRDERDSPESGSFDNPITPFANRAQAGGILYFLASQMPALRKTARPYFLGGLAPEALLGAVSDKLEAPEVGPAVDALIARLASQLRATPGDGEELATQIEHRETGHLQVVVSYRGMLMVYPVPQALLREEDALDGRCADPRRRHGRRQQRDGNATVTRIYPPGAAPAPTIEQVYPPGDANPVRPVEVQP